MECVECLYFDSIADRCVLNGDCVYEDEEEISYVPTMDDCDNCFFCVKGHCEKIGACRYNK